MCEHGNTVECWVPVQAEDAHEGALTWKWKPVDRCIAPIVTALNQAGVQTRASCCGHGRIEGSIVLADGRDLRITRFDPANYTVPSAIYRCLVCGQTDYHLHGCSEIVGVGRVVAPTASYTDETPKSRGFLAEMTTTELAEAGRRWVHGDDDE